MAYFDRTVVHILGCHMQAKRPSGAAWNEINWSGGAPEGRIAHGMRVASMCEPDFISFGTGASEKDGVKEAEWMRRTAESGIREMGDYSMLAEREIRKLAKLLAKGVARTDVSSQNTTEEIQSVFNWVLEKYPNEYVQVIFVTSAFHAARATNEAAKVAVGLDKDARVGTRLHYSISPAHDNPGETFVLEESHRGDMKMVDWSPIKQAFGLVYDATRLQPHIDRFGEMLKREKERG